MFSCSNNLNRVVNRVVNATRNRILEHKIAVLNLVLILLLESLWYY